MIYNHIYDKYEKVIHFLINNHVNSLLSLINMIY